MKLILLFCSLLFSAQTFACSCSYDWGQGGSEDRQRISKLLELTDIKAMQIIDSRVANTPMAYADPASYSECGCSRFVKIKYDVIFEKNDQMCSARAVKTWWNDKMKVKFIDCR